MLNRRRALMAYKSEPQGNRIDRVVTNGTSVVTLNADQTITISKWGKAWTNRFVIYFKDTIATSAGDIIKVRFTTVSGTAPSISSYVYIYSSEAFLANNKNFNTAVVDKDLTITTTADRSNSYLLFNQNASEVNPGYIFRVSVWVNSVLVLGDG